MRERADAAGRPLQPVRQPQPFALARLGDLVAHRKRLLHEQLENLLFEGPVAECLPRQMREVDRPGAAARAGRAFAARHCESNRGGTTGNHIQLLGTLTENLR